MNKKRTLRNVLLALLAILVVIQFIRPERNLNDAIGPNDITHVVKIPADVMLVMKTACYDCHSNYTHYYWYHEIMPLGWWLNDHVKDGKRHFNFSEFGTYDLKKKDHKLEEFGEEVKEREMPLDSYTWVHHDAKLSDAQIQLLANWASNARKELH